MLVLFVLQAILMQGKSISLLEFLALQKNDFFAGHIYQLFSYPFLTTAIFEVLFSLLLFWFLGAELETWWGERRYWQFLLYLGFTSGLVFLLLASLLSLSDLPFFGPRVLTNGILVVYALSNPERIFSFMMIFPIKAKFVCGIIVLIQLYQGFFSPFGVFAWVELSAMGFASLYYLNLQNFAVKKHKKHRWARRSQAKLRVVRSNDESGDNVTEIKPDKPKYWQ